MEKIIRLLSEIWIAQQSFLFQCIQKFKRNNFVFNSAESAHSNKWHKELFDKAAFSPPLSPGIEENEGS